MDAVVRIDLWSDLACDHCRAQELVLDELAREMGDRLELERHAFELRPGSAPLAPGQPRTRRAHETIEFARDAFQGDEVRRALFDAHASGRDIDAVDVLVEIVACRGMDGAALREALYRNLYTARVVADDSRAAQLGIRAAPMTIVRRRGAPIESGLGISGAADLEQVRRVVRKALTSS